MLIKFWGTRGSIPTSLPASALKSKYRQILTGAAGLDLSDEAVLERYLDQLPLHLQQPVGGETTCLEIRSGDQLLIIDAGSGIRLLGLDMLNNGFGPDDNGRANILMTHTHWDHIQGFPFFRPAFVPTNHFTFYSPFDDLAERLTQQQHPYYFPVPVAYMSAQLEFNHIEPNSWRQIGNFRIYPMRLSHPGLTYGYRIEDGQSCVVMATDSEYKRVDPASTEEYVKFFQDADLLIFDAQYSLSEALDKLDWGHSTAMVGAEFSHRANVKRLALFHHDPTSSDEKIWNAKEQAEAYLMRRHNGRRACEILVAYDGLTLEV
ncbi:MAG: MBL fold metallo-hydrolase [Anaerolineae bacterium]|nr:MBL fold metallo-hydrolase [Anaerolineae bacterium]